jgi:hypothetical protein
MSYVICIRKHTWKPVNMRKASRLTAYWILSTSVVTNMHCVSLHPWGPAAIAFVLSYDVRTGQGTIEDVTGLSYQWHYDTWAESHTSQMGGYIQSWAQLRDVRNLAYFLIHYQPSFYSYLKSHSNISQFGSVWKEVFIWITTKAAKFTTYGIECQLYILVNEVMEIRSTKLTSSMESSATLTMSAPRYRISWKQMIHDWIYKRSQIRFHLKQDKFNPWPHS